MIRSDYSRHWWVGGVPVNGPRFDWNRISQVVIHYPGNPPRWRVPADVAAQIRNSHESYVRNRGYSYGYNFVVVSQAGHPLDGRSVEVRGDTFRSAANRGVNEISVAIQVLQQADQPPTPRAVDGVRRLVGQVQDMARHPLRIVGHNDSGGSTRTACPGRGLQAAVNAGLFWPMVPPIPEGDMMIAIYKPTFAGVNANTPWVAVFQSGVVRRAVNADVRLAERTNVPIVDQDSEEQHAYLVSIFPK